MGSDVITGASSGRARQGWRREAELITRLGVLRDALFDAVGAAAPLPPDDRNESGRSAETVACLIHFGIARLRAVKGTDTSTVERLCGLILELQQFAMDFYLYETSQRSQRLAQCVAGLNRLRAIPDTTALLDLACEEIVLRCGFQRAVLSRVEGRSWRPTTGHFAGERESGLWFADWIDQSIPLDSRAPEAQLLAKRRPTLVYDTSNAPVYRPIIVDAGRSRSYVVVPIVHGDEVVGFVHADHFPLNRRADEGDRDVLWAFADGFSHIYERTVLLEQLRRQRDQVRELIGTAVDRMDDLCESGIGAARHRASHDHESVPIPVPGVYGNIGDLTERETEVFRLMVQGATNRAIAEQLVITEGTAKSHVKHILRKFGAANRAQAIAWSLSGNMSGVSESSLRRAP
jgi:DNA-binding CsgD family transcriptional regulator